ncbi:Hpt domain-containing protein [uncultured Muriicola sp.]|uniref:Hpt domain-containing protein n=1 Tax=uncultured Muriicola sp. TaxID=1583102 RepID=UPI0026316FCA|nr:Hpt domain-containing protein [uncultured Muriicola sp.]
MEQPNLTYIEKLSGNDEIFKNKFIAILKDEFPIEKEEYYQSLNASKTKETALIVHKLKHKLNILGMEKAYGLSVFYEEELNKGNTSLAPKFKSILDTIESYLNTI